MKTYFSLILFICLLSLNYLYPTESDFQAHNKKLTQYFKTINIIRNNTNADNRFAAIASICDMILNLRQIKSSNALQIHPKMLKRTNKCDQTAQTLLLKLLGLDGLQLV